ncbi:hypothetical protein PHLCEN_2v11470 [Hermanssonia centrifuga]|uniref:BTB domain-containing protein n=1 Tax=Hermanssonia centrifuga TaxID=98765 RepID=A0A2R6NL02_9APHY|nr:hypothetical protein PHLCEN_2v11470 [Hermanssonia centrifuga]
MSASSASSVSSTQSQDVWFDQGDVVVQADDAIFRVYSSVLIRSSPVFEDMLDNARVDTFSGCPVLRLQERGNDLAPVLRAMHSRRTHNVHFERNIFTIANLALEANAYILLPTVLLHCCLRQMADILLGFGPSEGFYDELDPANKRAVLFAQQHLSCRIQEEAFPDLYDFEHVVPECHDVLRCCRAKGKLTTWMKCSPYSWGYATPTMETFLKNFKFCLRCREAYIMSYSEGRRRIWADLPQQFGLPDWTVLAQKTLGEAGLSSSVTLDFNCHSRIGPVSHAARETSPMIAMGHTQSPTTFINGYTIRPLLIEILSVATNSTSKLPD